MLHPRIQNLFRMLELYMPPLFQQALGDVGDVQYSFTFDKADGNTGTLEVYRTKDAKAPGVTEVQVEKDWFSGSQVWFRKRSVADSRGNGFLYEAYIEYISDYRDAVFVDLKKPLMTLLLKQNEWTTIQRGQPSHDPAVQPELFS